MKTFTGKVINGKLTDFVMNGIIGEISALNGEIVKVTVEKAKKLRSQKQSRFYRGVIVELVRAWLFEQGVNLDKDETHEWIVRRVWKFTEDKIMPDGSVFEVRRSSKEADTKLWELYQDVTRQYFAEKGLILPFPREEL